MFEDERIHKNDRYQRFLWLIETGSPAQYFVKSGWVGNNAWFAHKFETKEAADEFLTKWKDMLEKESGIGGWRAEEHCFISEEPING